MAEKKVEVLHLTVILHAGRKTETQVDLPEGSSYFDLLRELKVNPETVVVFKNGIPVAFDSVVEGGTVEVMRVVSGG
ncbi:MoaD/ThiS family protein [Methanocella arvoryzae]|uniref:MoaD/ThiS family protein n=1 Tax=Methanocella arvoryzae TaxID=1175445 RepID=UPI0003256783|nr:MoaD/ThiS family protein [Methanocella arvoryzae]